jgi:hypothetical protein
MGHRVVVEGSFPDEIWRLLIFGWDIPQLSTMRILKDMDNGIQLKKWHRYLKNYYRHEPIA